MSLRSWACLEVMLLLMQYLGDMSEVVYDTGPHSCTKRLKHGACTAATAEECIVVRRCRHSLQHFATRNERYMPYRVLTQGKGKQNVSSSEAWYENERDPERENSDAR